VVPLRPTVPKGLLSGSTELPYAEDEARETHSSLREKQIKMGRRVFRIWTCVFGPTLFISSTLTSIPAYFLHTRSQVLRAYQTRYGT